MTERHEEILGLIREGLWVAEIARRMNLTSGAIWYVARRYGVAPQRKPKVIRDMARVEKMASMYRQGITLAKLGEHFGVTRERVRQLLRKFGVERVGGGRDLTSAMSRAAAVVARDARSLARWGYDWNTMAVHRRSGAVSSFTRQRNTAKSRGVEWKLKFSDWFTLWEKSGKLAQRGRGIGKYVMSRINDEGGYAVGNVHIQLATDNASQARKKYTHNKAPVTGVWCTYPGLATPWIAKVGKHFLGMYATEADGFAARQAFIAANPDIKCRPQMSQPSQSC